MPDSSGKSRDAALTPASTRARFEVAVVQAGGARAVAQQLGYSRAYIDMIRKGERRPGLRPAVCFERSFGIACADWIAEEMGGATSS